MLRCSTADHKQEAENLKPHRATNPGSPLRKCERNQERADLDREKASWQLSVNPISVQVQTHTQACTHVSITAVVSWAAVNWLGHILRPCSHCQQQTNNKTDITWQRDMHKHTQISHTVCRSSQDRISAWEHKQNLGTERTFHQNMKSFWLQY